MQQSPVSKPIIFTDHTDPVLTAYLKEISKFPIYPANEIVKFIEKAQNGDLEARDIVVRSNLRFVVTIAKQWQGRGVPLMDLISEGNNGLLYAIEKFDINRGTPFISYAVHWIKQYIYQAIYWTGREIRLPVSQQVKIIQLLKAEADFAKSNLRNPSPSELSEITGIDEEDINFLSQFSNKLISVDDFLGGDSENNQVCDVIPDKEPLLDETINKEYLYEQLEKILSKLSIREHDIICLFFGLGREPLENKVIGDLFGVGTERIRQIKENALKELRNKYGDQIKQLLK